LTGYGPRVAAPWRSVQTFLAGEMTGRCGSGQAEAPGDGGARVGAVYVASGITRALRARRPTERGWSDQHATTRSIRRTRSGSGATRAWAGRSPARVRHAGGRAASAARIAGSGYPEAGPDPPARRGALSCQAAPPWLPGGDIRACERPLAVLTPRRLVLAGLDGRRLTQRDDRAAVALLTPG